LIHARFSLRFFFGVLPFVLRTSVVDLLLAPHPDSLIFTDFYGLGGAVVSLGSLL